MRRSARTILVTALAGMMLLGACGGDDDDGKTSKAKGVRELGQEGPVRLYEATSAQHVDSTVAYAQTPPVGGDHSPIWQDCGFYDAAIHPEHGVHSMEHGAVWITYRPDLAEDQVAQIQALASSQTYVLASPWEDPELPAPIVFSAWGAQLDVETLPSPDADAFMKQYRNRPDGPEPGAPCINGVSDVRD